MKDIWINLFRDMSRRRFFSVLGLFGLSLFLTIINVHEVLAQTVSSSDSSTTLGAMMCNVVDNMTPFLNVFDMAAYVTSVVLLIQGIMHLRNHHDDPRQYPHHKTAALFLAGTFLGALPSFLGMLSQTLFTDEGDGGGLTSCVGTQGPAGIAAANSTGLDGMMAHFVNDIGDPLTALVSIIAITMGVFMVFRGLVKASRYGLDPRTHSVTQILVNLIFGAILIATSQSVDLIMGSLFGSSGITAFSDLQWTSLNNLGDVTQFKAAMQAALTFFQLIGLISFVRGWTVLKHAVEGVGQATYAQGITHIVGGVLAMNIYQFMQMMDSTFNTQLLS